MGQLTRKQRAAVARAPKSLKGKLANSFARQDKSFRRSRRSNGNGKLVGVQQGVGAITRSPFGGSAAP